LSAYLSCFDFSTYSKYFLGSGNHLIFVRVRAVFGPCMFPSISVFVFVSEVSVSIFASTKKYENKYGTTTQFYSFMLRFHPYAYAVSGTRARTRMLRPPAGPRLSHLSSHERERDAMRAVAVAEKGRQCMHGPCAGTAQQRMRPSHQPEDSACHLPLRLHRQLVKKPNGKAASPPRDDATHPPTLASRLPALPARAARPELASSGLVRRTARVACSVRGEDAGGMRWMGRAQKSTVIVLSESDRACTSMNQPSET
jgi:hypothetical protein